ncbi:MJ1255/VC2487 family glycosyltransferase [Methanobrevibacter sp.]|uniref:MJ1255/VC2487 family glycosyltransferase n=1 Tax=Methanobrevibacter sp. TaxID=66852 RepID=UPI002611CCB8|nr:MJ1255/VC2487 family glycosyltransferase [uncultured Methanobrevibacter sp.]
MKLSIIIPTYNEEEYLPKLLKSIRLQEFEDYEVIVADANSCDNTIKIAEHYGCIVVEGGMPGVGRNNGAKIAKGEILLFLDSDLELTNNYLIETIHEFESNDLDIGITQINPISEKKRDKILHDLANWFMIAFEKIKPHGAGCYGIICKRELHEKYNGFDETLTFGEDTDYIERIGKDNKFKVLRNPIINVSTRRLEEEGLGKLAMQYGKSTFNDLRGIRTSAEELEYGFNHFPKDSIEKEDLMAKIRKISDNHSIVKSEDLEYMDKKRIEDRKSIEDKKRIESSINNKENKNKDSNNNKKYNNKNNYNNYNNNINNNINNNNINNNATTISIYENKENNLEIINTSLQKINQKKKIFYAVCGEGMGHAVRSAVILEKLTKEENKDKYEIYIFSSDRAYKYLNSKFDNVFEIGGFNTVYENNEVKNKRTLLNAIKTTPNNLKENYGILFKKAREVKPNIIISDFENYSSILSKIINVPLISLDNIHMITQTLVDYPPYHRQDMLKAKSVIRSYIMRPKRYILTSYFFPKIKNPDKAVIYPPVIRDKIKNLKTKYDDYIFVYQTSDSNKELIKTLKEFDEKFIVYGFNKEGNEENLTFRKFNEDKIYDDMCNAKAVISNGGFTLISEAIYLKKPIYSIPAIGNFEQLLNGFYIDKLGYGEMHEKINVSTLKSFLNNLKKYQKNLYNIKNSDNSEIIQELERSIEIFSKKY